MARCQHGELDAPSHKETFAVRHKCASPLKNQGRKSRIDFALATCIKNQQVQSEDTYGLKHFPRVGFSEGPVGWVD